MSVKILSQVKGYQPVTIELTFDTLKQLECFYKMYDNPYNIAKQLFDSDVAAVEAIDTTIDVQTLGQLVNIIDKYS